MKADALINSLEQIAPPTLAESWDQVGLHIGDRSARVKRVLLCIDLTGAVLAEARSVKADFIIAYHPLLFKPIERLTNDHPKSALAWQAARAGITVYSPHTALDAAPNGLNDFLASLIGTGRVRPILPAKLNAQQYVKLVTFIPESSEDRLRNALSTIGAGVIGNYEACSFVHAGHGTFRPMPGSQPAVGVPGNLERVHEIRMEVVVPRHLIEPAVGLLRAVHPYEEPAFDIIELEPAPDTPALAGQGRVLELKRVMSFSKIVERLRKGLKQPHLKVHRPAKSGSIRRVGLCAGAGASLIPEAGDIDVFFTGEVRHHDALDATSRGIGLILAGHTQTERCYLPTYRRRILDLVPESLEVLISKADKPPLEIV
ncbi:MAG: Nif3-like dinuclear metal center hexameric protein [Phycisphaeraceae bacterium]